MKDNRLEDMKKDYETIEIAEELRSRVEEGIRQAKKEVNQMKGKTTKTVRFWKRTAIGVAAALLAITVLANSGPTVAQAMEKIPVLGMIAKVVTFREYEDSTNQMEANIKVPELSIENEDGTVNEESTEKINKTIEEYTNEIIARYEADVEASGGEGYQEVDLDYSVITDSDRLFSIRFDQLIVMASGTQSVKIYHVDKQTGEMINLSGIFKEGVDFINPISDNIKEQMKAQMAEDETVTYWLDSETPEWDFQSITEDSTFYINEAGKLVIVFDEYEVAPGSMGSVEFEIPTEVTQELMQEGF